MRPIDLYHRLQRGRGVVGELVQVGREEEANPFFLGFQGLAYSFRRLAPTLGHMLHLDPEELLALGNWQAKSEVAASKAAMPLHYSAARYTQSMRGKHRMLNLVAELATYEAWELVPEVLKVADTKARAEMDKTVWSSPLTEDEAQRQQPGGPKGQPKVKIQCLRSSKTSSSRSS